MELNLKLMEQVRGMMYMQDQLETHLSGEDWKGLGHDYALCIVMEAAEAIDHYGYKHWKAHEPSIAECKMEIVDIIHFWLAGALVAEVDVADVIGALEASFEAAKEQDNMGFVPAMAGIIASVSTTGTLPLPNLVMAMQCIDMTWDELHMLYLCKNTLNVFRRDMGYADGSYIKMWDGVEDNVHAEALARRLDAEDGLMMSTLYDELTAAYSVYARVTMQ